MGALIATACHRATQSNEEGGTDDEQFRVEAVVDRVNTTWQVWQGLTFGCTQCHDHPYDPLRNVEYYQFMAFFNNTQDSDLDSDAPLLQTPLDSADCKQAHDLVFIDLEDLARRADAEVLVVIDDPVSILRCTNKVFHAELLARHEIPHPTTMVVHEGNVDEIADRVGLP